jgi:hypothetical protein
MEAWREEQDKSEGVMIERHRNTRRLLAFAVAWRLVSRGIVEANAIFFHTSTLSH